MNRSKGSLASRLRFSERGQSLALVPAVLGLLLAASAFVIDMGNLYFSYEELLGATQAAAKAGGTAMPNPAVTSVTTVADLYSGQTSSDYNYHPNLNITSVNVNFACVPTASYPGLNLPPCAAFANSCPSATCNAIQVTESATVTTFFAKVFGVTSLNISATASSSASGGGAIPYHIMLVLDTTHSMGTGTDTGCTTGGGSYTPEQCAQLGVQTLLSELAPCATNFSSCSGNPPVDEVGLMVFPGLCDETISGVTTSSCNPPNYSATTLNNATSNSTYAPDDYACPAKDPPIAAYNNDPEYLVLGFQSNYRSSDTATTLNFSSDLVEAVGAGTNNCGMPTPGGEGTFYAGAIIAAQQYLINNHTSGIQDVMIVLSDGNASASSTQMAGSVNQSVTVGGMSGKLFSSTAECTQAVNAANWAKTTKRSDGTATEIYSVSYGSETSGCTSGESVTSVANPPNPSNSPCATMDNISSLPLSKYFFSVPQSKSGQGTICNGAVGITQLDQVFTTIAGDLTSARLIPNSVF